MYDPGTTTFMIMSCALILMMGPALALFYGGLSRRKNVVNTMLMCVMAMGVVGCLWAILGDSIAYGGPDAFDEEGNLVNAAALFVGGFDRVFSSWSLTEMLDALAAMPEDATYADVAVGTYPGLVDVAFQAAFAMVTAAIVTGSLAGRMKFGALTFILVVWSMVVYAPMAHMVWGSGLIGNENAIGAIDFAGGTAVHICSGLGGLVLALILGKRMGFEVRVVRPHNVPAVMLGCGLLFVGWFGFNGARRWLPMDMPPSPSATRFLPVALPRQAGLSLSALQRASPLWSAAARASWPAWWLSHRLAASSIR